MKITNISEDTYTTLTNNILDGRYPKITYVPANGTIYDDFIGSLSYDKTSAINAAYHNGYITDEEAIKLKEEGFVRRNEYTYIQVAETLDKVYLYCNELTDDAVCTRIFKLSYLKNNGILIDELNADITN